MKHNQNINNIQPLRRRVPSIFLAFIMLFSIITVGLSPIALAGTEYRSATTSSSDLKFIVPEAIYLYPNGSSTKEATSTPFQYYINNNTSNSPLSAADTTGKIYYIGPSTGTISYKYVSTNLTTELSGGSVTLSSTSIASGNTGINITGGSSPSLAAATTGCYIRWELSYSDTNDKDSNNNAIAKKIYAYTYVYKPYVVPVGGFNEVANESGLDNFCGQLTWISGIHSVSGSGSYYPNYSGDYGLSAFITAGDVAYVGSTSYTPVAKAVHSSWKMAFSNTATSTAHFNGTENHDNKDPDCWGSTSSGASTFDKQSFSRSRYTANNGDLVNQLAVTPKGIISIDTSRYTSLAQIPNVAVGIMVTDNEDSDNGNWYIADYTTTSSFTPKYSGSYNRNKKKGGYRDEYNDFGYYIANRGTSMDDRSSDGSWDGEGVRYSGAWTSRTLLGSTTSATSNYTYSVKGSYNNNDGGDWQSAHIVVNLYANQYNKASLRSAVQLARAKMAALGVTGLSSGKIVSRYFDSNDNYKWNTLQTAYINAEKALAQVDGTITNPDTLATELTSALNALCTKVTFATSNSSKGTISTNSGKTNPAYVTIGTAQKVSVTPTTYVTASPASGYHLKGWNTSSAATTGTASLSVGYNNTVYAIWEACSGGSATCTAAATCSTCGKTYGSALGHNSVTDAAVAPTCTETGLTAGAHCSRCNTVLTAQTTVAALGHNSVADAAVAATCTETGLTAGAHCSRCNTVLTAQTTVAALGHASVTDAAVAATCTGTGLTAGAHCSRCNTVLTAQTTVAALGHDYGTATYSWNGTTSCTGTRTCSRNASHKETKTATITSTVTTAATCCSEGVRTYTATFGNTAFSTQTKTETVAKDPNNHASYGQTLDAATASEPTYDADGYTGDTKCDGCHAVRAAGERIPKLTELIELPDVSLEDTGLTGVCSISPSVHESDISYEIVGFAGTGSHTLYKAANKPNDGTSLKLKNARIWKTSDSAFGYRFSSMDFTNLESFYVLVKVSGTNLHKYAVSDVYTYEKITLVPPKNVLFDDASPAISFANSQTTDSGYGVWKRINDSGSEIETSFDQFDDPATAKSSYGDSIRYSLGDAHQVSVSDTIPVKNGPTAQFTFTGSAFDVISVTDSSSGVFVVSVYAGASATGKPIKNKTVDTYYGYTYSQVYYNPLNDRVVDGENPHGTYLYAALDTTPDADKIYNDFGTVFYTRNETYAVKDDQGNPKPAYGWVLSSGDNAMYQVPALSVDMGAVGQYTVVIQPRFTARFGHYNEDAEGVKYFNFTFDGVRIYNPANGNNAALAKYAANGETYTNYRLIRDEISAEDMVVIDGSERLQGMQLAAYIQGTPNEELYLMPNGTTGFDVDISGLTDARIGLRAANGTACTVTVGNGSGTTRTIKVGSATEQYYSVKDLIPTGTTTGTITLTNGNSGILSVTKLMTTSNTAPASPSQAPRRISVSPQTAEAALATVRMLNANIAIHEESVQAQTGSDGTVTLTLTTGADAETVVIRDVEGNVIDPDSVAFTIADSGEKNWTVTFTEAREGTFTYTLQAEYENGYTGSAEPTEATVTVSFNTDPTGEDPIGEDPTGTDPTGEELLGGLSDILAKLRNIFDILREFIRTIAALFR